VTEKKGVAAGHKVIRCSSREWRDVSGVRGSLIEPRTPVARRYLEAVAAEPVLKSARSIASAIALYPASLGWR